MRFQLHINKVLEKVVSSKLRGTTTRARRDCSVATTFSRFKPSLLLLASLLCCLGDFALATDGSLDGLDNSDGDCLPHVSDGESAQRRELGEGLNTHWLRWNHLDHGSICFFWGGCRRSAMLSRGDMLRLGGPNSPPDLMNFGEFSTDFPVRRSIFSVISENLQAMWAVWQSRTGA